MKKTTIKLQYDTLWKLNIRAKQLSQERKAKVTQDELVRYLLNFEEVNKK